MDRHTYASPREELHEALNEMFRTLKPHGRPISVKATVEWLRKTANTDGLTFRNLADVVADYAILKGLDLHFDTKEAEQADTASRPVAPATPGHVPESVGRELPDDEAHAPSGK